MAYIGNYYTNRRTPNRIREEYIGNGSLCFRLSQQVVGSYESNILVVVDNVIQEPLVSYSITDLIKIKINQSTDSIVLGSQALIVETGAIAVVVDRDVNHIYLYDQSQTINISNTQERQISIGLETFTTTSLSEKLFGYGLLFTETPSFLSKIYVTHFDESTYNVKPSAKSVGLEELQDSLKSFTIDSFVAEAEQASFTLSIIPPTINSIMVFVNGILQYPNTNYTINSNVLEITTDGEQLSTGDRVLVYHVGLVSGVKRLLPDQSVTNTMIQDGSITAEKLSPGISIGAGGGGVSLTPGIITTELLANNSITTPKISDLSVTSIKIANGEITTDKIRNLSVTTEKLNDASVNVQKLLDVPIGSRNVVINGGFDIWQRGTSFNNTNILTGNNYYFSSDRWRTTVVGSNSETSRIEFPLGQDTVSGDPTYYLRNIVTSVAGANNRVLLEQRIESVKTLANKTATLSFWCKADSNKPITVVIKQNFGLGGSPSPEVVVNQSTVNLTQNWNRYTINVNFPSILNKVLGNNRNDYISIEFWLEAGNNFSAQSLTLGQRNGIYDFAQVQLEPGSVATDFETLTFDEVYDKCLRYYQKSYTYNTPPGTNLSGNSSLGIVITTTYAQFVNGGAGATVDQVYGVTYPLVKYMRNTPTVNIYSFQGNINIANLTFKQTNTTFTPIVNIINEKTIGLYFNGDTGSSGLSFAGEACSMVFAYTVEAEL